VARDALGENCKIFAVDLLHVDSISGVEIIQGDFLGARVQLSLNDKIREIQVGGYGLGPGTGDGIQTGLGEVDLVMSDMMGSMSGVRTRDISMSLQLCEAAWGFARGLLRRKKEEDEEFTLKRGKKVYPGGNLV
jgi:23S rRNA (uridine2552-2'-O)-methyltransferase